MNKKFNFWKPVYGPWTFDSTTGSFTVKNGCSCFHERSITKHAFNSKMIIKCDSLLQPIHKTRAFQIYLGKSFFYFSGYKLDYLRLITIVSVDTFIWFVWIFRNICWCTLLKQKVVYVVFMIINNKDNCIISLSEELSIL